MDTLFRRTHKSRNSASTLPQNAPSPPNDLTGSVPYSQLPASHPPPVAGPSTSTVSFGSRREAGISVQDVGAPNTNPGLASDGTVFNIHRQPSIPPPSPHRSTRSRASNTTDAGRLSVDDAPRRIVAEPGGLVHYSPPGVHHDGANGIRYQGPSVQRTSSRSTTSQMGEFGGSRHPFANQQRDSDAMSIRTVSSVNSQRGGGDSMLNRDLGRYPSFAGSQSSRAGPASRSAGPSNYSPSIASFSSNIASSRMSEEFHFPRPSDADVDELFQRLLQTRNLEEIPSGANVSSRNSASSQINIAKTAASLSADIKWQMIEADARTRHDAAREVRRKEEEMVRSGKVAKRGTASAVMKNSPEWFLKKVLDGTITTAHISTLNVSLRSQPLE